ncbi:MAG: hypothetical protein V1897_18860, partial [Pseudomonadota bacterium]
MLKKPQVLSVLIIIVLSILFLKGVGSAGLATRAKESRAERLWKTSGHADTKGEPFVHWNNDSPREVPTSCAKCHSTPGYLDFLGADGSTPNVVDKNAPVGTTVECDVCHLDEERGIVRARPTVTFPSGLIAENLGPEGLCMECHQGRSSTKAVNDRITNARVTNDDSVNRSLSITNPHYFGAAATQFGTMAKGGYEYTGKSYDAR